MHSISTKALMDLFFLLILHDNLISVWLILCTIYNFRRVSTLSITSKALIRSISKSITGAIEGLLVGKKSLTVSLVGEWLLLLVSLLFVHSLIFEMSNSWLLLIPGVSFRKLISRNIFWSSSVSIGDFAGNETVELLCEGDWTGDLMGDLMLPLEGLERLMRWWSHTTMSSICASVLSLSAWWRVSIRIKSVCVVDFRFISLLRQPYC